jgi:single-strand DNA-binding protein
MNVIAVSGNLAKEAQVRYLPNGDPVANFTVADNMGKDKGAIFWNCQLFGKRAESLSQYLVKGLPVTVTGNLTERAYTDKNGVERKSMDLRVADVALQGGKRVDNAQASDHQEQRQQAPQTGGSSGFSDMADDIPFTDPMKSRAFALSI